MEYDMGIKAPITREFNDKLYVGLYHTVGKISASEFVEQLRSEGHFAEIVKEEDQYTVFYRSKNWSQRRY